MKKLIVLLCILGLVGCASASKCKQPKKSAVDCAKKQNFTWTQRPVFEQKEWDSVISVFSEAIKNKPNYAGAYYNRAIAYFYKKDYNASWKDVHKAESLGVKFNQDFMCQLKKASGREK